MGMDFYFIQWIEICYTQQARIAPYLTNRSSFELAPVLHIFPHHCLSISFLVKDVPDLSFTFLARFWNQLFPQAPLFHFQCKITEVKESVFQILGVLIASNSSQWTEHTYTAIFISVSVCVCELCLCNQIHIEMSSSNLVPQDSFQPPPLLYLHVNAFFDNEKLRSHYPHYIYLCSVSFCITQLLTTPVTSAFVFPSQTCFSLIYLVSVVSTISLQLLMPEASVSFLLPLSKPQIHTSGKFLQLCL